MCPTYQYHITHMKQESKQHYRYQMVLFAREFGNKPAAREYNTSVHTVRKWVRRYNKAGIKGLTDQARTPQFSPNKCTPTFEKKVIKLRTQVNQLIMKFFPINGIRRHLILPGFNDDYGSNSSSGFHTYKSGSFYSWMGIKNGFHTD